MRVPQEILLQILQAMVEVLPLDEIFRARLVNRLFADELTTILIQNPRLEDEGFGARPRPRQNVPGWRPFPRHLKLRYMRYKLEQHANAPCVFSIWMHQFLDLKANRELSSEQRDLVIEKLLHAVASGQFIAAVLFCHREVDPFTDRRRRRLLVGPYSMKSEPIHLTFRILMACSAIRRGDAAELDLLLQQGLDVTHKTYQFGMMPLDLAAKRGNGDVVRILVKHNCPLSFSFEYHWTEVLSVAARSGNKDGLDVWIEDMKRKSDNVVGYNLNSAIRSAARIGYIDMVEFLLDKCNRNQQELRYNALIEAVEHGRVTTVEWLLDRGGFDPNIPTNTFPNGPLLAAINSNQMGNRRSVTVKALLEGGVDPNRNYPRATRIPLQKALEKYDMETAALLVEYGAELSPKSLPAGCKGKRLPPVMFLAAQQRRNRVVSLLLDKGADPVFNWKGKKYIVQLNDQYTGRVERIFGELGFDETEVKESQVDCIVMQIA